MAVINYIIYLNLCDITWRARRGLAGVPAAPGGPIFWPPPPPGPIVLRSAAGLFHDVEDLPEHEKHPGAEMPGPGGLFTSRTFSRGVKNAQG